MDDLFA